MSIKSKKERFILFNYKKNLHPFYDIFWSNINKTTVYKCITLLLVNIIVFTKQGFVCLKFISVFILDVFFQIIVLNLLKFVTNIFIKLKNHNKMRNIIYQLHWVIKYQMKPSCRQAKYIVRNLHVFTTFNYTEHFYSFLKPIVFI